MRSTCGLDRTIGTDDCSFREKAPAKDAMPYEQFVLPLHDWTLPSAHLERLIVVVFANFSVVWPAPTFESHRSTLMHLSQVVVDEGCPRRG
jgi:hypothetical protein